MPAPTFALALKRAREKAGLSQKALAAKIEMTGSYISQLESGARRAPRPKVVARLAKALACKEADLQELAGLERTPAPLRKRLERANREQGKVRRSRDRLLVTTLFHMARRPKAIDPMASFLDLPTEQRLLIGRLVSKARKVKSLAEAERKVDDVLADTGDQEREMLARVLPGVLAGEPVPKGKPRRRLVGVYDDMLRSASPVDEIELDARLGSEDAYFVRVADDEAHPRIEAGDLLLLDPDRKPHAGDTVIVRHEDRDLLRTWHKQGGRVRLDAMRPDQPPLRVDAGDVEARVVLLLLRALR